MERTGLVPDGRFVPVDAVLQGRGYFEPRALLDPGWRSGDSIWALVSKQELARSLDRIRRLDAAGELDDFFSRHDAARADIGQCTFVCARKRAPG